MTTTVRSARASTVLPRRGAPAVRARTMPLDSLLARHWLLTLSSLASRRRLPVDCPSIGLPLRRAFTLSSLPTAYARNATASASEAFERGLDFLVDAWLMSNCDGLVGKFSSGVARAAYSLMATRGGIDCLRPYISLDHPWCFGLGCRKEGDEQLKAHWRRQARALKSRRSRSDPSDPAAAANTPRASPPPSPTSMALSSPAEAVPWASSKPSIWSDHQLAARTARLVREAAGAGRW